MWSGSSIGRRAFLTGTLATGAAALTTGAAGRGVQSTLRKHVYDANVREIDLGGPIVKTWVYGDRLPGKELRVRAGEPVEVRLKNHLPADSTIHWHGLRIANAMDGVPGVTQDPVRPGEEYRYVITPPDAGTFWLHSHGQLQTDRGLYAPLIVDDPDEPGDYDHEWIIVLDDWLDGTGTNPEEVFHHLRSGGHHGGDYDDPCLGHLGMHLGDVHDYAYYLINGRVPEAPRTFTGRPGQRVRLRIINAAADTIFRVALGDHRFRVTHTDGFPVRQRETQSLLLGMSERIDAIVELGDGVFPLVAHPEGKHGTAMAVVRTSGGAAPGPHAHPRELDTCPLLGTGFVATDDVTLTGRPDREHDAVLTGDMHHFIWKINDAVFGEHTPLPVRSGEGVRLRYVNRTMMPHPMHLHGHTFQVINPDGGFGPRKDTALVPAKSAVDAFFVADNPGDWVTHCHNEYHMAAGMMTTVVYT
ncbi:multicopper oxidase family protein [Haloechinothrix halophila]|uniref:multicopper oxidase family protein n=1 Tax=Haloechinothrix halophila TaxID=1069073 RepID=UPI000406F044|nr:multicopper oxidase family protein [Haloechinothrix halophila]